MDVLAFELELKNYRCFSDNAPARFVVRDGFTAFVGPNNAGKSTALRFFYEFRQLFSLLSRRDSPSNANDPFRALWSGNDAAGWGAFVTPVRDQTEVFTNTNDRPLTVKITLADAIDWEPETVELTLNRPAEGVGTAASLRARVRQGPSTEPFEPQELGNLTDGRWHAQGGELLLNIDRFTRFMAAMADAIYIGAFRNAIHTGTSSSYYDLQIGQAFIEQWRQFKTGPTLSHNLAARRLTEEIRRVFDFDSLEINASANGDTLKLFVDDQSYVLPELGAGLAQFVILLAFVATRRPSLILIDEPELNLHPLLQQDLLLGLRNYSKGRVMFATHNIDLARAVAHGVYICRREAGKTTMGPLIGYPRLAELLGELSFGGYQELGFSKILLVEGPQDVTAIRELLRLYQKDHEVVLVPLGGASMINRHVEEQLHEIKRVTPHISALIDSERDAEEAPLPDNVAGFVEACSKADVACHVLTRRAFEHYLPDHAIKKVKGSGYRSIQPHESFKDLTPRWGKSENAAIAREMSLDDLRNTDLGDFLTKL